MQNADLLIKNTEVYTQDENRTVLQNVDVVIKDGKFLEITPEASKNWHVKTVIDGSGKTMFPGMMNLHVHVFQSLLKGLGADLKLIPWIQAALFKTGPAMTPEIYQMASRVAAMEALKAGVTSIADFNYLQHRDDMAPATIETMEHIGIREIYMDVYHDTGLEMGVYPDYIHPATECVERTAALVKKYQNKEHPLVRIWMGASVPWGTTRQLYEDMVGYSKEADVPYTMHILETQEDNDFTMKEYGKPVVEALDEMGVLTDHLLAVHCVCVQEDEIETFVRRKVNVVYCPAANAYLGSGIPRMSSMCHKGVNITMGTDGAASNNSGDMIESLKLGLLLQKAALCDPTALTAQDMLDFTTINAAKASWRPELGRIEKGKTADCFLFNPDYVRSTPNYNTMNTLMYNASQENVETTIVNGKVVYDKGEFSCGLNEQEVAREADKKMKQFIGKL